jgi:hypothetical protein
MAWMMALALLNVITVCPMLARQVPAAHACCEHSSRPSVPCSDSTSNACPYSLLEKSQAAPGVLALLAVLGDGSAAEAKLPALRLSTLPWPRRLADSSDTYLLLRALLI